MNIPSLPTDNLYKFMAVSGTVLMVVALWVGADSQQEQRELRFAHREKLLTHVKDLSTFLLQNPEYIDEIESLAAETPREDYLNDYDRLTQLLREAGEDGGLELVLLSYELDFWRVEAEEIKNSHKWFIIGVWIYGAIGGFLAGRGFQLWHRRLQTPMDQQLLESLKQGVVNDQAREIEGHLQAENTDKQPKNEESVPGKLPS